MASPDAGPKVYPDFNKDPLTVFSVSRSVNPNKPPGSAKSNRGLIDDLRSAAGLTPQEAHAILMQITWWDAMAGGKCSATLCFSQSKVSGGRLGRDHTPDDVPNHYVRDRIMDYIDTQVPEDGRDAARKAVFPDLSADALVGYSALLAKDKLQSEVDELRKSVQELRKCGWKNDILETIKPIKEARLFIRQQEALDALDDLDGDIDLTPRARLPRRLAKAGPFPLSVVWSDELASDREYYIPVEEYIVDRDCDQLRAMIKRLVKTRQWTIEELRKALGQGATRLQMVKFLSERGENGGRGLDVYILLWAFFKRREQLGVLLTGPRLPPEAFSALDTARGPWQGGSDDAEQPSPDTDAGSDPESRKRARVE